MQYSFHVNFKKLLSCCSFCLDFKICSSSGKVLLCSIFITSFPTFPHLLISWTWWLPSSNFFTDDFLCKAFLNLNTVAITLLTLFHLEVLPNRSVSMVIALTKISFLSSGSWASLHYINTLLWRCHNDSNFQRNRDPWNHILTFVNFVGSISLEL